MRNNPVRPVLIALGLGGALVACAPTAPYSNLIDTTGRGVGFSDYAQYLRAQEELTRLRRADAAQGRVMGAPAQVAAAQPNSIGAQAVAAVRGPTAVPEAPAPVAPPLPTTQVASAPAPVAPRPASVSNQTFTPQPFGTPAQNTVITRDFVPQVQVDASELGAGGPNLFVYALSSTHRVGELRYTRRHPFRWQRWEAACSQYPNQDLAQEAFLSLGGPDKDPNHMDPDGDGFACWWDPSPFRQAATTVRARQ
ncbi:MAG: hypothetical protein ACK4HW_02765 [Roseinatronobacter sp.]